LSGGSSQTERTVQVVQQRNQCCPNLRFHPIGRCDDALDLGILVQGFGGRFICNVSVEGINGAGTKLVVVGQKHQGVAFILV